MIGKITEVFRNFPPLCFFVYYSEKYNTQKVHKVGATIVILYYTPFNLQCLAFESCFFFF